MWLFPECLASTPANGVNLTLPCPFSPLIVSLLQTLTYKGWEWGGPTRLRYGFNETSPLNVTVNHYCWPFHSSYNQEFRPDNQSYSGLNTQQISVTHTKTITTCKEVLDATQANHVKNLDSRSPKALTKSSTWSAPLTVPPHFHVSVRNKYSRIQEVQAKCWRIESGHWQGVMGGQLHPKLLHQPANVRKVW